MEKALIMHGEFYETDFTYTQLALILSNEQIENMTLSVEKGYYDFRGATITNLSVYGSGITVKNAKITGQLTVKFGSHNCTFENIVFESELQPVVFENDTCATLFDRCTFIGKGNAVNGCVMYANRTDKVSINDTLNILNCRFENYDRLIDARNNIHCVFTGGRCKNVNYIIYNDGTENGETKNVGLILTAIFNAFNFNTVKNVLYSASGGKIDTSATIVINAVNLIAEDAVVNFEKGRVNLECNMPLSPTTRLFSNKISDTRYCNVKRYGESDYKYLYNAQTLTYTVKIHLLPGEIAYPFGNCHIHRADWANNNSNIEIYADTGRMGFNDNWNSYGLIKLRNTDTVAHEFELKVRSYNALSIPEDTDTAS